jgi:hypothetical protein
MQYYASIVNGLVTNVIVADADFINRTEGEWVQTFYNGNQRKNFAGIGHTYDTTRDAFIAPQPYNSWTLNEDTCQWDSPVAYPTDDKMYLWDDATTNWIEVIE